MKTVVALLSSICVLLFCACGGSDASPTRDDPDETGEDLNASVGGIGRPVTPSSTCGSGLPRDVVLLCGVEAAPPRKAPLPVASGETITLNFATPAETVLVELKRARPQAPIVELRQLQPAKATSNPSVWTFEAPRRILDGMVLGIVALYEEPVPIARLSDGSTVPIQDAMIQFQLPIRAIEQSDR